MAGLRAEQRETFKACFQSTASRVFQSFKSFWEFSRAFTSLGVFLVWGL